MPLITNWDQGFGVREVFAPAMVAGGLLFPNISCASERTMGCVVTTQ